jgi:hypothetical protein
MIRECEDAKFDLSFFYQAEDGGKKQHSFETGIKKRVLRRNSRIIGVKINSLYAKEGLGLKV